MAGLPNSSNHNALEQWRQLFEKQGKKKTKHAQHHFEQMLDLGLPTRKHEDWKYTPLDGLLNHQFMLPESCELTPQQCHDLALPLEAWRLVFVDGQFNADLSDSLNGSGFDVTIEKTASSLAEPVQAEVFLHLTESLADTVTQIRVAPNQVPAKSLLLMHITRGSKGKEMATAHYRHHLSLGQGAQASIIEHYVSFDQSVHFTGARFTADIADNSHLQHYKLAFENDQSYHFAHNDLVLGADARAQSNSYLLGASVLRHHTSTQLNGENSELHINSLALPVNKEVCDTRTWVEHNKGFCNSRQLHKIIVRDKGRAVFNGMIKVAKHAIKTDGQMTNNNLLLGRLAEVDTKPQLEIYADDVKCSHGATLGRIDDEQMFYLRSRGINEQLAQRMIIHAFAAALTEGIVDQALKQQVLTRINQRFTEEMA